MKNKAVRPLLSEMLRLALPVVGEMGLNTLLGIADTIMISYMLGKSALSASGFTNQMVFTIIFIFTAFNVGATALISRNFGERNYDRLRKIASQAFFLNLILGVLLTICAILFQDSLFSIFDLANDVKQLQSEYFKYIGIGILPLFLNMNMTAILRGAGDTKTPLFITLFSNILNILGNYVLITGFGPFPELGIAGAAISTTISRIVAFFLYSRVLLWNKGEIHLEKRHLRLSKDVMKPLLKISLPSGLEQALMQLSFLAVGVIISQMDTLSEAGFRVVLNIESISYMPAIGLSIAAATLTGKALGEGDKNKAYLIAKLTSFGGLLWGVVAGGIFLLLPKPLLYGFTNDLAVIQICIPTLFIAGINQPFLNYMISTSGAIRGAGETFSIMLLTIFRLWLINVPFAYYFIIHAKIGLQGIWLAELISFSIAVIFLFLIFQRKKWLHKEIVYEE